MPSAFVACSTNTCRTKGDCMSRYELVQGDAHHDHLVCALHHRVRVAGYRRYPGRRSCPPRLRHDISSPRAVRRMRRLPRPQRHDLSERLPAPEAAEDGGAGGRCCGEVQLGVRVVAGLLQARTRRWAGERHLVAARREVVERVAVRRRRYDLGPLPVGARRARGDEERQFLQRPISSWTWSSSKKS